ncbi:MAG: hypothetical protein KGJ07_00015 [Patescibacteria group bacterium]|nr:hypothetical protein [Patescibacteria group bacterium]
MDGGILQQRIQYGYGKCAEKVGAPFFLFRSATPINPLNPDNLIGIINSSSNVSWDYMRQQRYGNAVWNLIIETRNTAPLFAQPGDFLVPTEGYFFGLGGLNNYLSSVLGSNDYYIQAPVPSALGSQLDIYSNGVIEDNDIYFVAANEFLLPPLGVNCNRTIQVIRANQNVGAGYQGYAEYLTETSTVLISGMPASILEMGSGGEPPTKLPTEEKTPRWIILIPDLGGVIIRVDDIIIDDLNQEYVITDNEKTFLGWRLLADQVVNSR